MPWVSVKRKVTMPVGRSVKGVAPGAWEAEGHQQLYLQGCAFLLVGGLTRTTGGYKSENGLRRPLQPTSHQSPSNDGTAHLSVVW